LESGGYGSILIKLAYGLFCRPVRVKLTVDEPKKKWGSVSRGDVGTLVSINNADCTIKFPSVSRTAPSRD
jgi:hypothetical protein